MSDRGKMTSAWLPVERTKEYTYSTEMPLSVRSSSTECSPPGLSGTQTATTSVSRTT